MSKPSTSRPGWSHSEKLTGPMTRFMPLLAQPVFRRLQQRVEHVLIVHRFDEAEMAGGVVIALQMQLVDLGGDAAHRLAAAIGQEEGGAGVLEIGIVLGLEMEFALQQQRRHPVADRRR